METVEIVKVAVEAAPYSIDKPYDYLVPEVFWDTAVPGARVMVPFGRGNRKSEGLILSRTQGEKLPRTKAIVHVLDEAPVLDEQGISLALWMRQRYFATLYQCVKLMLPTGLWYQISNVYTRVKGVALPEDLGEQAQLILDDLSKKSLHEAELSSRHGVETVVILAELEGQGLIERASQAQRKLKDKNQKMVELAMNPAEAMEVVGRKKRTAPMQYGAVEFLCTAGCTPVSEVRYFTGASLQTLRNLEKMGIVTFSQEEVLRVPEIATVKAPPEIHLNQEQTAAFESLLALTQCGKPAVSLLQGVTGSGKTQVYIRLVQEVLTQGKTAMVLVPEIVLTPQMMQRFGGYFGNRVAMLHSGLRTSERYDQWKRIRRGDVDVVLGTRSAVFAPLQHLGLIVLDEEQESSYQSDKSPRYHARDIAKFRCTQDNATLVLGSATPLVETAYYAKEGIYHHAHLTKRYNQHALPKVLFADLREELLAGNSGAISSVLKAELEKNIENGEQSILFLNRRGNSRMLVCGSCGKAPQCPNCSVALTYHSANGRMMCHYCGFSRKVTEKCPSCDGILKYVGFGTQKVEQELAELFPGVGVLRMDADTTARGHEALLQTFEKKKIPILLGTQMVAKGLDFENVTLVGVLSADLSLYIDHYRAAERTFHLLTQVVGRAGRGEKEGRAVIQTFSPQNDVLRYGANQDFEPFFQSELGMRQVRCNPPFRDLFTFTISGSEEAMVVQAAAKVRDTLHEIMMVPEVLMFYPRVLGPAPAPVLKVNNRFRYRVTLMAKQDKAVRERISWLLKEFAKSPQNRGLNMYVDCNGMD